jgi:hypothetical protein
MAATDTDYLKEKSSLQKEIDDAEEGDNKLASLKAADKLGKLEKANSKNQLKNIGDLAKASKSMFKEKTFAYRALDAVEKTSHVIAMANKAAEFAKDLGGIPGKIALGVGDIFAKLGPYGFPIAAAFIALMSSLGAKSATVPQAGFTAEDRQETQGTGTSWVNGKKVENGGGVFGDAEAKSESIVNSLEILKDNSIEGLGYDDRMIRALENIEKSVGTTARTLYGTTGLRAGSITGSADLSVKTSGISGLFGKSTSKEIIDSGLLITGTFNQLANSAAGLVKAYETIRTTTKSSGFLGIGSKTKITDTTSFLQVSAQVETEISSIFKNAQELFIVAGDKIGLTAKQVTDKLGTINVGQAFTSLRGLKGEELEKEFSAVIGNLLDTASSVLFGQLENFRKFGEGMLETVVRVVDGSDKVKVALESIGASILGFNYDITEALIDSAGGLDEFTKQVEFFSSTFLTEAERLEPITRNVTKVLSDLGLSSVDTRVEFKDLVRSLDLTSVGGRDLYQALQDIAPAFAKVYPELKKVASAEELRNSKLSQAIEILKLQEKTGEALILQRLEELSAMDDSLKSGQLYLYALQDEASIKAKLKTAYEKEVSTLKNVITGLKSAIKTLGDFKDSLLLSDKSTLTPMQKYEETKRQAMEVAAIASGIATTDAEKEAISAAINQLPTVSGNFLEASRTLFASSSGYTTDFNSVLDILASTSSALDAQLSDSELQLKAIEESTVYLSLIQDNTQATSTLLAQYIAAQAVTAMSTANYSMNLTAVTAELLSKATLTANLMQVMSASIALMSPSLSGITPAMLPITTPLNSPTMSIPTTPDRAYSLGYTSTASNDALVAQVAALTAEVTGLRADQQAQTGDLIATNYDANNQTASSINTGLLEADNTYTWTYRKQFLLA